MPVPVDGALLLTGMDSTIVLQRTCAVKKVICTDIYNTTAPSEPNPWRTFA